MLVRQFEHHSCIEKFENVFKASRMFEPCRMKVIGERSIGLHKCDTSLAKFINPGDEVITGELKVILERLDENRSVLSVH